MQCAPPTQNKAAFYSVFPSNVCIRVSIGDGSCFFHSICSAITKGYDEMTKHEQTIAGRYLRDKFAKLINEQIYSNSIAKIKKELTKKNRLSHFEPSSYTEFKKKIFNFKVWADLVMISIFALRLHYNILFWDSTSKEFYYGTDNFELARQRGDPTIIIEWQSRSHFNLIVQQKPLSKNRIKIKRQFHFDNKEDNAFLNRIEKEYNRSQ